MSEFSTVDDVIRAADAAGSHWFRPSTMRFFRTRVLDGLYGGRYFVTSEKTVRDSARRYTVREAVVTESVRVDDGRTVVRVTIETVGEFQQFATAKAARGAAKRLAAELVSVSV